MTVEVSTLHSIVFLLDYLEIFQILSQESSENTNWDKKSAWVLSFFAIG